MLKLAQKLPMMNRMVFGDNPLSKLTEDRKLIQSVQKIWTHGFTSMLRKIQPHTLNGTWKTISISNKKRNGMVWLKSTIHVSIIRSPMLPKGTWMKKFMVLLLILFLLLLSGNIPEVHSFLMAHLTLPSKVLHSIKRNTIISITRETLVREVMTKKYSNS